MTQSIDTNTWLFRTQLFRIRHHFYIFCKI